jgi:hypothetical protein
MCCGAISRGERLSGYNKCCRIWAKVLEEVGQTVEEDKGSLVVLQNGVVAKTLGNHGMSGGYFRGAVESTDHNNEDNGKHTEA